MTIHNLEFIIFNLQALHHYSQFTIDDLEFKTQRSQFQIDNCAGSSPNGSPQEDSHPKNLPAASGETHIIQIKTLNTGASIISTARCRLLAPQDALVGEEEVDGQAWKGSNK